MLCVLGAVLVPPELRLEGYLRVAVVCEWGNSGAQG